MPFVSVHSLDALTAELDVPREPRVIYKHSPTCGLSMLAHAEVEMYAAEYPDERILMIDVLDDRALSNWVETRTGVLHESPQILILMDGAVCDAFSHRSIKRSRLTSAVSNCRARARDAALAEHSHVVG